MDVNGFTVQIMLVKQL